MGPISDRKTRSLERWSTWQKTTGNMGYSSDSNSGLPSPKLGCWPDDLTPAMPEWTCTKLAAWRRPWPLILCGKFTDSISSLQAFQNYGIFPTIPPTHAHPCIGSQSQSLNKVSEGHHRHIYTEGQKPQQQAIGDRGVAESHLQPKAGPLLEAMVPTPQIFFTLRPHMGKFVRENAIPPLAYFGYGKVLLLLLLFSHSVVSDSLWPYGL